MAMEPCEKPCRRCRVLKPLDEFYVVRRMGRVTGRQSRCRSCCAELARLKPKRPSLERTLLHRYNLTLVEYEAMVVAQGGVCAICGQPPKGRESRLSVDHDHLCCPGPRSCGRCIRGLLCRPCNSAVAMFGEDLDVLTRAMAYLNRGVVHAGV